MTDTVDTTTCGTQRRDTVGNITNCYQTRSGFTPMSEYCLSQSMFCGLAKLYWINAAVVFRKRLRDLTFKYFPSSLLNNYDVKTVLITSLKTHTPEFQATIRTISKKSV